MCFTGWLCSSKETEAGTQLGNMLLKTVPQLRATEGGARGAWLPLLHQHKSWRNRKSTTSVKPKKELKSQSNQLTCKAKRDGTFRKARPEHLHIWEATQSTWTSEKSQRETCCELLKANVGLPGRRAPPTQGSLQVFQVFPAPGAHGETGAGSGASPGCWLGT